MDQDDLYARHREKRMEEAVAIAAELFMERGIDEVKMTDVADAAAMGVASLYRYFGSKSVLVMRAGALMWRNMNKLYGSRFSDYSAETHTGMERIRLQFSLLEELYRDQRPFVSLVGEIDDLIAEQEIPRPELENYNASLLRFMSEFREAFDMGVRDGTVRGDVDPILFFHTACHAVLSLGLMLNRGPILTGQRFEDLQELHTLIEFALAYLSPKL